MFRIDSFGAAPGNLFTEGNPSQGDPSTKVSADWLNYTVQEELCGVVESAGLTLDKADPTQLLQAIRSLGSGGSSSVNGVGSNEIINGDFGIMQRATSAPGGVLTKSLAAAVTAYVFDRWQSSADGGGGAGAATLTRQTFTVGQTTVPRSPKYFARHAQTVAATVSAPYARQKVESVQGFQGTYTFSIWMQATAAISCSLRITQNFGTGGSGDVVVTTQAISVTTSWERKTVTVTLPSVLGKTITQDSNLRIEVLFPTGSTFTVDLADAQLEASPSATGFQRRSRTTEIALCQRYYEKSWAVDLDNAGLACPTTVGGASGGAILNPVSGFQAIELMARFRVEKRYQPIVHWCSPSGGQADAIDVDGVSTATNGGTTQESTSATGYPVRSTHPTLFPAGLAMAHWTADAEL